MANRTYQLFTGTLRYLCFALLTAGPWVLLNLYQPELFDSIIQNVSHYSVVFCMIRWCMILFIAFFWSEIVRFLGGQNEASPENITFWQGKKYCILTWLIIFEILICEKMLVKLTHLLLGG